MNNTNINTNIDTNTNKNSVSDTELAEAFGGSAAGDHAQTDSRHHKAKPHQEGFSQKLFITFLIIGVIGLLGGVAMIVFSLLSQDEIADAPSYADLATNSDGDKVYSPLTGEVIADASLKTAPTYCIQTPNGTDGARPQAGLNQAGVIFEAIAEAGITRFAAIYQNPTSAIIGPIRSLRIYYLQWDTPFDCTIVHAGGSGDALEAVSHGYKDLTEDYNYMYRGTYGGRLWNNLFTTSSLLKQVNSDRGYGASDVKGFQRMTPAESNKARVDNLAEEKLNIVKPAKGNTSALKPAVAQIGLRFGGWGTFNVDYTYDAASDKYLRSYQTGAAHEVYSCPDGDIGGGNPEDACSLVQMAPSVVVAMKVQEHIASDNYHEDITAIGSGEVYIFQNGTAIHGTWSKASAADQISFKDESGAEIKLAPGQTFVSAVPDYGSVEY